MSIGRMSRCVKTASMKTYLALKLAGRQANSILFSNICQLVGRKNSNTAKYYFTSGYRKIRTAINVVFFLLKVYNFAFNRIEFFRSRFSSLLVLENLAHSSLWSAIFFDGVLI